MKKMLAPLAVAVLLLTGCSQGPSPSSIVAPPTSPAPAIATSAAPYTPAPVTTPTPASTAVITSGSYANDLAKLGIVPDSITRFANYMKSQICDQTGVSLGADVRSIGGNQSGGGIQGVRLAVAYFCPEKSQEVEKYLEYFRQ